MPLASAAPKTWFFSILADNRSCLDISSMKSGEIPGLDGLRAISILLVVISHYGFINIVPGGLGVTIFFFISGFLITTLLLREKSAIGSVSIRKFYIRRFLRLEPELFAYILISALIGIAYIGIPRVGDFLSAFFYVTNYYELTADAEFTVANIRWPQLWSLAVEEHYYLTFPLLFVTFIATPRRFLVILMSVCVGLLAWRSFLISRGAPPLYTYLATDTRLDSIAFGCLGSLILWRYNSALAYFPRALRLALPSGLALILLSLVIRSEFLRDTVRYSLQGIALMMIVAGLFTPTGRVALLFLDMPVMRWMGRMSFAAYLWHSEWLYAGEHFLFKDAGALSLGLKILFALAGCAVTFGIAAISHRCIYRPVLGLRRRFGSQTAM